MVLKKGSTGQKVKELQSRLKELSYYFGVVDSIFGPKTYRAVKAFQSSHKIAVDGIVGPQTWQKLKQGLPILPLIEHPKYVVFVGAGHGSLDDTGRYHTAGKYYDHGRGHFHIGSTFYEGVENRIIAERFIQKCAQRGINCIRLYHPYKDTPLEERAEIVKAWLRRGYYGYLHSFHSNAISLSNSKEKLNSTRGYSVFNTVGNNFSDDIATEEYKNIRQAFPDWKYFTDMSDGDPDFERNFKILRSTNLTEFKFFGAILSEFGFFTSYQDAEFIMQENTRWKRVMASVDTAEWVRDNIIKLAA